jgi:hypothetical protein
LRGDEGETVEGESTRASAGATAVSMVSVSATSGSCVRPVRVDREGRYESTEEPESKLSADLLVLALERSLDPLRLRSASGGVTEMEAALRRRDARLFFSSSLHRRSVCKPGRHRGRRGRRIAAHLLDGLGFPLFGLWVGLWLVLLVLGVLWDRNLVDSTAFALVAAGRVHGLLSEVAIVFGWCYRGIDHPVAVDERPAPTSTGADS